MVICGCKGNGPAELEPPGAWPTERGVTVDSFSVNPDVRAGDGFAYAGGVEPDQESPHGCWAGWVFLGWEDPETGEEEIERVPCKRCRA